MASTNGYGQPNSMEELERDAERTRADLAHTVDEIRSRISDTASDIRERVSPAAIKQDVKDYVHQSGQQLYHTIESRARENPLQAVAIAAGLAYPVWRIVSSMPVPVLLIGAGIALSNRGAQAGSASGSGGYGLLDQGRDKFGQATGEVAERARYASGMVQDATTRARETAQDAAARARGAVQDATLRTKDAVQDAAARTREQVSDTVGRVGATVRSTAESVTGTVSGAASSAREAVESARDAATRTASSAASTVSDAVSSSYETTADAAAYAREQAMRAAQQTRETFVQTMDRHPLLVGGLGLAIGALLASAIPSTRPEKQLFGESSDELRRRAREMASQGYEAARNAAGELIEDTARAAKEQGLSMDALRQAADELGSKVKTVAERTTGLGSGERQSETVGSSAEPKLV